MKACLTIILVITASLYSFAEDGYDLWLRYHQLDNIKDGELIDIEYELPDELTRGLDKITITFSPHEGHRAGPCFYARTIRK